jgi:sigma-E factor negative regulatory protein RseB
MVNAGGRIIEQIMFTSLTLLDEEQVDAVMEDLAPVPAEQDAMPEDMGTAMSRAMPPEWKIESLPAGFTLAEHFVRPQGEAPAHEQMVFTDGLASVSVFIEKQTAGENPFVGSARMGAVHAFGNVVDGHQVTVIGDVPRDTVKLIGQSIKYQK